MKDGLSAWLTDYWWVIPGAAVVFIGVAFFAAIPWQARRRGYSFWLWLIFVFVSINPIFYLVLLALMPNRARKRQRMKFRAELEAKLAARKGDSANRGSAVGPLSLDGSILPERSLGDMPTVAPPERSLGDEATRA